MTSFYEMHGFYYEFKATSSANLWFCITADQILSLHFIVGGSDSVDTVFMMMIGQRQEIFIFFQKVQYSNIHNKINNQSINLQNYTTLYYILYTLLTQILMENVPNCIKIHKRI
jgi:hypothetical protein